MARSTSVMLQKQIPIIVLFSIISSCAATVPSVRATKATESLPLSISPGVQFEVAGDIMAIPFVTATISIRRRGPDGIYNEIFQLNEEPYAFTNGEWISISVLNETDGSLYLKLYKLDGDVMPTNPVFLPIVQIKSASFFPGNVFVGESYDAEQTNVAPNALEIYSYTDSWAYRGSVDLNNHTVMTPFYSLSADGKFVITANESFIDIWEFQSDPLTFNRVESVAYDFNYIGLGLYNGVDTVVTARPSIVDNDVSGAFLIYTKTNGEWSMTQNITAYQLGLRPTSYLGTGGLFLDENTFMLNALLENSREHGSSQVGKSVVMSRGVDGSWSQTMQIEVDPNDDVAFGMSARLNSYNELLIPGVSPNSYTGYVYSTCLPTPINVTCNDILTPTDCNNLDVTTLYTINSSPACGEVNVTVVSSTTTDNQVKIELKFRKTASSTSCTSTVTCLTAPTTAPIATPVASSTPVNAPTGKISHSTAVEFTGAMLLGITLAL